MGRRSREVAVRAVNAGTRCIRRRGRAAPRPGAAGSQVHAVSGCPAAGKGPAGGRAARSGATGDWIQASGSFWRRPRTPARPSPGPAAPPRAAPMRDPGALRAPPRRGFPPPRLGPRPVSLGPAFPRVPAPGGGERGPGLPRGSPAGSPAGPQQVRPARRAAGPPGARHRGGGGQPRPPRGLSLPRAAREDASRPRRPAALLAGPAPRCPPSSSRASSLRVRACSCAPSRPLYTHVVVPDSGPPQSPHRDYLHLCGRRPRARWRPEVNFFLWGGQSPTHSTRRLQ